MTVLKFMQSEERARRESTRETCDCRWGWHGTSRIPCASRRVTQADVLVYLEFCERVKEQPIITPCEAEGCEWRES